MIPPTDRLVHIRPIVLARHLVVMGLHIATVMLAVVWLLLTRVQVFMPGLLQSVAKPDMVRPG